MDTKTRQETCAERLPEHKNSRLGELAAFNRLSDDYEDQPDDKDAKIQDELGSPNDYGLSFDLESKNFRTYTWTFRYLLSTGGPGDWFDIEVDEHGEITGASYHFQDWFDHAEEELHGDDLKQIENFAGRFLYLEEPAIYEKDNS